MRRATIGNIIDASFPSLEEAEARRIAHELLHDKLCPEDASPSLVVSRAELASELLAILSGEQVSRAVVILREWA